MALSYYYVSVLYSPPYVFILNDIITSIYKITNFFQSLGTDLCGDGVVYRFAWWWWWGSSSDLDSVSGGGVGWRAIVINYLNDCDQQNE